jgi:lipopolysaccharide biosynthesis protein
MEKIFNFYMVSNEYIYKKIAVLIWIYHEYLTDEIIRLLRDTTPFFDLYIGLCEDNKNTDTINELAKLNNVKSIQFYPNFGVENNVITPPVT